VKTQNTFKNLNLKQFITIRFAHISMHIIVHSCVTQYHTEQFC